MLQNYIKIAMRNFRRHFSYTVINIAGLSVGLACCLLIFLFVRLEVSYDRFHKNSDRIYRVVTDINQSGQTRELAWSSPPLAEALVSELPEVMRAVRIHRPGGTMRRGEENEVVEVSFVDSTFFEVFDFELSRGDAETALNRPGSLVLTQEQAERFFKDEDPMNKSLTFADTLELEITGILSEIPPNSHYRPAFIANIQTLPETRFQNWGGMNLWTYLLLRENVSAGELESKFPAFIEGRLGKTWARLMTLHLQPLPSIYFESDRLPEIGPTGNRNYVYIFSGIGVFILIIACINFMNLAMAQSFRRAREVGIRKVLGVHRSQLVRQFLGESILLTFVAMLIAFGMAQAVLQVFGELSGYELSGSELLEPPLIASAAGIAVLVGVLSGSYPAFVLSLFRSAAVLSGNVSLGRSNVKIQSSNNLLRRVLVVVQFGITIVLLIGTVIIGSQLDYIRNRNLGFDKEQVVVIRLSDRLRDSYDPLKQNLVRRSDVLRAGASSQVPGVPIAPFGYMTEGTSGEQVLTNTLWMDEGYLEAMDIALVAGRSFTLDRPSELRQGFLLNEAAAGHFGWSGPEEALGKSIRAAGQNGVEGRVIGIVGDFNYESLHSTVHPLVLRYRVRQNFLTLRIAGDRIGETMESIEEEWETAAPDEPLVSWFLDDRLQDLYEAEGRMSKLFRYFSGMAIIIACMGLFGLASLSIQKRTREIGIRKVLGASLDRILLLLSKEYILLLIVANLIAWPFAWLAMSRWLRNFAYQIEIGFWVFPATGGFVLLLALLTVGYHATKAAWMNPVETLRSE